MTNTCRVEADIAFVEVVEEVRAALKPRRRFGGGGSLREAGRFDDIHTDGVKTMTEQYKVGTV